MDIIKIEDPHCFVYGDLEDFEEVETVVDFDSMYKDYAPATTICKQLSTGKFFALDWEQYQSHYGCGEDEYPNNTLYEVYQVEVVTTTKEWKIKE